MHTETKNIVVLGGGYGGLLAALRLAGKTKRLDTTVTLVNALDHFVERPRLHEQATGTTLSNNRPINQLLRGTKARFLQGWVTAIDPDRQCVHIETVGGKQQLSFHYLINALGSRADRSLVPGVDEHAYTLDPYGNLTTDDLHSKLKSFGNNPFHAVVVGGGATGVEVAPQIKTMHPRSNVSLVTQGKVGAFKNAQIQKHIKAALTEQSIDIYEHCPVSKIEQNSIVFDSRQISADIIIWAGGFVASPLARKAGLQVNTQNQVLVDPYLRSISHPNIYAVGDAAHTVEEPGAPMRMIFTALVSGAQAADNIVAEIKGKSQQPLSYAWYGQGIALGPQDAVGFPTYPADAPWRIILRRKLAVNVRNFFVWYLGTVLRIERVLPGFFFWNGKKRYAKQWQQAQKKELVSQT